MNRVLILLFLLPMLASGASTWYIDIDNVSGTTNGTSWATAWVEPADVQWGSVSAGDTIEISDGTYTSGLVVGTSGTSNAPIVFKVSQDVGHNGSVIMDSIGFGNKQWITIQGALDSGYTNPTNILGLRAMTNNIGLTLNGDDAGFYMTIPVGIHSSYVEIADIERGATGQGMGIWANFTSGGIAWSNCFKFMWIHDVEDDGMQWIGSDAASGPGNNEMAFCIVEWVGDNGFEGAHSWSFHDNIFGPSKWLAGHPDGWQTVGGYFEIYNNICYDFGSSMIRIQATQVNHNYIRIYNNLLISGFHGNDGPAGPNGVGELSNTAIEIAQYADGIGELEYMIWDGVIIANNTFYTTNSNMTGTSIAWVKRDENQPNAFVHNVMLTNSVYANNICYVVNPQQAIGSGGGVGWQEWKTEAPWGSEIHYTSEADVICDFNTIAGTLSGVRKMGFFGTLYDNGEAMAASSIYDDNNSTAPVFVEEGVNFELSSSDTAALNTGTDLSSFFDYDILNRSRNVSGSWDRGAYEYQLDPSLIVFLSFDNDISGSDATDDTGNGYDGIRFTLDEDSFPTNQPVADIAVITNRPNATGYAMDFQWATNAGTYGDYERDGGYFAITNIHGIFSTNLNKMTLTCWARYNTSTRLNLANPEPTLDDQEARLVMGGGHAELAAKGGWGLGRYNQRRWLNNTRFVIQTNNVAGTGWGNVGDPVIGYGTSSQVLFEFPDHLGEDASDTLAWNHYAVVFDEGLVTCYYNGVACATNDLSPNQTTITLGSAAQRPYDWIAIGVNPHLGTPEYDEEGVPGSGGDFPNNGFMNGGIDQVRIYAAALSYQEIIDIANSEGAEFADAPSEGGGGGDTTRMSVSGNVIINGNVTIGN